MEAAYVYRLAGALGSELQRLSERFGADALAGLVSQVVRLLEVLETLASAEVTAGLGRPPGLLEAPPDSERGVPVAPRDLQVVERQLVEARAREQSLQSHLAQMEEELQRLLSLLAGSQPREGSPTCTEREVMLRLKEVVDRQRDTIRAQDHEIQRKSQDVEALQEQLNRFMAVNESLHRKLAVGQSQLKSALDRRAELEASWEAEGRSKAAGAAVDRGVSVGTEDLPGQRSFSREELQQILQERNELKTSLFLAEQELAFYHRELLNDKRVPTLLLDAVKSAIKKQRQKIWAKMLGTAEEEPASREKEEEREVWSTDQPSSDCTDGPLPESKIKNFFGQWYDRSTELSSTGGSAGAWEMVSAQHVGLAEEERGETAPGDSHLPGGPSPLP